jgi:ABC-type sugar transport system ATPase subunit
MVGRRLQEMYPRRARQAGPVLLEADDVHGRRKPLGAGFALRRGEVLGLAGLVGAGRTELLRALFGLDPVRRGRVRVGAWEGPATPRQRLAQGMGLLSEDRKGEGLAAVMSLADNLTLSSLEGLGPWGTVLPGRQEAAVRRWVEALRIRCGHVRQPVAQLSGGNQQKVALAKWLQTEPELLLLDEPTRGIDVGAKREVYQLMNALTAQGIAILLITSELPELLALSDRLVVMHRGRVTAQLSRAEATPQRVLEAAMGKASPDQS